MSTVFFIAVLSFSLTDNVGHMSIGGVRSESLSTELETIIELLRLATHKARHYLYAVLAVVYFFNQSIYNHLLYQIPMPLFESELPQNLLYPQV